MATKMVAAWRAENMFNIIVLTAMQDKFLTKMCQYMQKWLTSSWGTELSSFLTCAADLSG